MTQLPPLPLADLCLHEVLEWDDGGLTCHLRAGHDGPHAADKGDYRIEWYPRAHNDGEDGAGRQAKC